ncbi:MAG: signal peptidase [Actinomycetota bacterium]
MTRVTEGIPSADDPTPVGGAAVEELDRDLRGLRRRREKELSRTVWEWAVVVVVAVGAALLIRVFLFQQYYIDGPSMEATLQPSDRVLVNKLSYRLHDVNRGDVVVFDRVTSPDKHDDLIKRVIALPGERLEVRSCVIYIDGVRLEEPYLSDELLSQPDPESQCGVHTDLIPTVVPEGMVFVMGDNRPQSFDSRDFGPIDIDKIRGRAFTVIWPLSSMSFL